MDTARIERRLPAILAELGSGPYPDYTDALLARTASARQRPSWAFLERWIPLSTAYSSEASPRHGSRGGWSARLPSSSSRSSSAPRSSPATSLARYRPRFGPAANGLLAFSVDGDIHTSDPVTGETKAIVTGPDDDVDPVWSRDGTQLVFVRRVDGERLDRLYSSFGRIRSHRDHEGALRGIGDYGFSPDGRQVIFVSGFETQSTISSPMSTAVASGRSSSGCPRPTRPFDPPDGEQIAFTGSPSDDARITGIYVVNTDGSQMRMLVEPHVMPLLANRSGHRTGPYRLRAGRFQRHGVDCPYPRHGSGRKR